MDDVVLPNLGRLGRNISSSTVSAVSKTKRKMSTRSRISIDVVQKTFALPHLNQANPVFPPALMKTTKTLFDLDGDYLSRLEANFRGKPPVKQVTLD